MLHIITLLAMASTIALGIYLAYVPYEEEFKRNNKRSSAGNKIPKGVPVAKGFQVGKEFNYKPKAPNVSSNGDGTRGEESSKDGSYKQSNASSSVASHNILNDRQRNKDVVDTSAMKMSNISSPNPFAALGVDEDEDEESHMSMWLLFMTLVKRFVIGGNGLQMGVSVLKMTIKLFCSFIYADNYYVDRRALWNNLDAHASLMRDKPWVLLRDFNVALNLEDHSCGGYEPNIAMPL
ncbi:hypothetical protein Tco_1329629 [Tanacetum coccineum]